MNNDPLDTGSFGISKEKSDIKPKNVNTEIIDKENEEKLGHRRKKGESGDFKQDNVKIDLFR